MNVQKNYTVELLEKLKQGTRDIFTSGRYQAYLDTMAKFTSYSARNCLLIAMQRPDATHVAGMAKWKELHRTVKKGEKAIRILAPSPYKIQKEFVVQDKTGDIVLDDAGAVKTEMKEVELMSFRAAYVFDIAQTEGKELPDIVKPLTDSVKEYEKLKAAIEQAAPCKVKYCKLNTGANGFFSVKNRVIVLKDSLSEQHTLKTLLHEIAHADLHDPVKGKAVSGDRRLKEVQAESVAYIVSSRLGIDTSSYSFGYVAGWSSGQDVKELTQSAELIKQEADAVYERVCQQLGIEPLEQEAPEVLKPAKLVI